MRYVTGLTAGPDGAVYLQQIGNPRVAVLHADGSVANHRPPDGRPGRAGDAVQYTSDGDVWFSLTPLLDERGRLPYPRPIYVRLGEGGAFPDTLWAAGHADCPLVNEFDFQSGFWDDKREPFLPKVTWALGPNGSYAVGCPADYRLRVHRPEGKVIELGRDREPVLLSDEEKAFWEGWQPMPSLPQRRPSYARIILTADRRIWVWPTQPGHRYRLDAEMAERTGRQDAWILSESGAFDVFDEEGRWVGVVALPEEVEYSGYPTTPGVVIRGDTIWALSRTELDVEQITRYRVEWR